MIFITAIIAINLNSSFKETTIVEAMVRVIQIKMVVNTVTASLAKDNYFDS